MLLAATTYYLLPLFPPPPFAAAVAAATAALHAVCDQRRSWPGSKLTAEQRSTSHTRGLRAGVRSIRCPSIQKSWRSARARWVFSTLWRLSL